MVAARQIRLDQRMRDRLMPLHLRVASTGHILCAGPTLRKLRPAGRIEGQRLLEVFEFVRPELRQARFTDILQLGDTPIVLRFRDRPHTRFKGILLAMPDEQEVFINLSFGISAIQAVQDYDLTNADFSPTDLTIEMLYVHEANRAVTAEFMRLNERLERSWEGAELRARTDSLTGLGNRRALDAALERILASGRPFAVMRIDLDKFKAVNDTHGHAAGDAVLVAVAERLLECSRRNDFVARVGGDEFVILLPDPGNRAALDAIGRRIIDALERPVEFEGQALRISATVGHVHSRHYPSPDPERMLEDADQALYHGKRSGRAQVVAHAPPAGQGPTSADGAGTAH